MGFSQSCFDDLFCHLLREIKLASGALLDRLLGQPAFIHRKILGFARDEGSFDDIP
jgi:hypothetical protein